MDLYAWTLLIGYSFSLLLVVLYFVWEDGLCHYSRRVEAAYLSTVLSSIYIFTAKFGFEYLGQWDRLWSSAHAEVHEAPTNYLRGNGTKRRWEQELRNGGFVEDPRNILRGNQTIRHLLLIVVLLHIGQKFVVLRVLPTFYDTLGYAHVKREAKLWRIAMQQPKAVRIAGEISDLVHEIVRVDSGLFLDFLQKATGFILLVLLMLAEFTEACEGFWHVAVVLGDFIEVAVVLLTITHAVRRALLLGSRVQKLNDLFEEVVQERRESYLTYILATVSMPTCMEVSRGMLEILTHRALEDMLLDTTSKAILIDALQRAGLRSVKRQEAIGRIITSTYGYDLTNLKNLIDGRGGYHNAFKLVYQDISNHAVREQVLRHVQAQANVVRNSPGWNTGVKVLSDLDDTLFCSGGHFPAGCDRRFPKGVIYPGCLTLFRVLDKNFNPLKPSCNLVFLSARPHVYKGFMEEKSYSLFLQLVEQDRLHTIPTLLPGQLSTGLKAMLGHCCCHRRNKTGAWREVGMNKYNIFVEYLRLYPEYDFIFCGDDGQGDLLAAQYMIDEESKTLELSEWSESEENWENQEQERLQPVEEESSRFEEEARIRSVGLNEFEARVSPPRSERSEGSITSDGATSSDDVSSGASDQNFPRRCGGHLRAALIHEVVFQEETCIPLAKEDLSERGQAWHDNLRQRNLIFHRTYVGAAVELHLTHPDLVSLTDLQSVAQDAIEEFEEAKLMYPEMSGKWEDTEVDLVRDLERANQVLQASNSNHERLRRPRPTAAFEESDEYEEDACQLQGMQHGTTEWLEAGGLAGAGELRHRFLDLMPKTNRRQHHRRRQRKRESTSREMVESFRQSVLGEPVPR